MTEPARKLSLHVDGTTVRFLALLTLGWSVIAIGLLRFGVLATLGALVLAPLGFATGCAALSVALGKSLWGWTLRVLLTPLVWYGMLLPTFEPEVVSIDGGGTSLWSLGVFLYGLPWSWVLATLWTFFVARLTAREERLVREDTSRGRRDGKLVVSAGAGAGALVAVITQKLAGDVDATAVAAACSATLVGWFCVRFPASIGAFRRRGR